MGIKVYSHCPQPDGHLYVWLLQPCVEPKYLGIRHSYVLKFYLMRAGVMKDGLGTIAVQCAHQLNIVVLSVLSKRSSRPISLTTSPSGNGQHGTSCRHHGTKNQCIMWDSFLNGMPRLSGRMPHCQNSPITPIPRLAGNERSPPSLSLIPNACYPAVVEKGLLPTSLRIMEL